MVFKYRSAKKDKIDEFELENTGGDWLFLIASINNGTTAA